MIKIAVVDITQEEFWKIPHEFMQDLIESFPMIDFIHAKNLMSLKKDIEDCQAIISIPTLPSVVKRMKSLDSIFVLGSGIPEVVLQLQEKKEELSIRTMTGINASSVADQALYLALKALRADGLSLSPKRSDQLHSLIIGTGKVAKNLEDKFLSLFKTTTILGRTNKGFNNFIDFDSLNEEVLATYDVVVIATAYNDQTKKLINKELILKLNKTAIIVNVARAEFFEELDLLEILQSNPALSYLTDVTHEEIYPADGALNGLSNFYHTPHMGGTYEGIWNDYLKELKIQLKEYLDAK